MSKGKLRTISRLARLGAGPFLLLEVGVEGRGRVEVEAVLGSTSDFLAFEGLAIADLARPSRRFLRVTERSAPLKTCAWSFETASWAVAGDEKRMWAIVKIVL